MRSLALIGALLIGLGLYIDIYGMVLEARRMTRGTGPSAIPLFAIVPYGIGSLLDAGSIVGVERVPLFFALLTISGTCLCLAVMMRRKSRPGT